MRNKGEEEKGLLKGKPLRGEGGVRIQAGFS